MDVIHQRVFIFIENLRRSVYVHSIVPSHWRIAVPRHREPCVQQWGSFDSSAS